MTLIQGAGVRALPSENRHIFAAVLGEAAEPVEEFHCGARQRGFGRPGSGAGGAARRAGGAVGGLEIARAVDLVGQGAATAVQHARAADVQAGRALGRDQIGAQHEHCAARTGRPRIFGIDWFIRTSASSAICRSCA